MMTQGETLRGLIVGEVSACFSVHEPVDRSMPFIDDDVFEDGVSESLKAACAEHSDRKRSVPHQNCETVDVRLLLQ